MRVNRRPFDNKRECEEMNRKGAEGLPVIQTVIPAANEEFTDTLNAIDGANVAHSGWDPYEVWRTRVKASFRLEQESTRDQLRG
jgi:hypothetical protein